MIHQAISKCHHS